MKSYLKDVSVVIVSYKSYNKIKKIVDKISSKINIIIIENSSEKINQKLKSYRNIKIFYVKNIGYGASINLAINKIKSKYICVVQPDVKGLDTTSLRLFHLYANKLKDKFSVIGPHFLKASYKGHFQTNTKYDIKEIHNVHGSVMFFYKKNSKKVGGFDRNIFLYWEETDYTKRAKKFKLNAYQLNLVKVKHEKGKAVQILNTLEKEKLNNLYSWHFTWSKVYYYKKHYTFLIAILLLCPLIIRSFIKKNYYKNIDKKKYFKYKLRWEAIKTSLQGKKSFLILKNI